jgi:hypothetical protein
VADLILFMPALDRTTEEKNPPLYPYGLATSSRVMFSVCNIWIMCGFAQYLRTHNVNYTTMDATIQKRALQCMSDVYNMVLEEKAKYDPRVNGSHVMESFEFLSGVLHKVSCDAMSRTQLSLFDPEQSAL